MGSYCSRNVVDPRAKPVEEPPQQTLPAAEKPVKAEQPHTSWVINPRVCWRHPALRIFVAVLIMVQDFLLYGEDPINDSYVDTNMSFIGEIINLLISWPSEASLIALRVGLMIFIVGINMIIARRFIHNKILRDCCGLSMFGHNVEEKGESPYKGSLFVMSVWAIPALYVTALAYNAVAPSVQSDAVLLESACTFQMRTFGKATQCWSVFLDIIGITMITDTVLQDRKTYPEFAPGFKWLWNDACGGWVRILGVWFMVFGTAAATTYGILCTGHGKGKIEWNNRFFGGWTETTRTWFLSWVIFCDLLTVCQDWEFPTFSQPTDASIKVAGTWATELSCSCLAGLSQFFHIRITGKWFTFGPLLAVIGADLFSLKNQMMYTPDTYGQYTDPKTGRVWGIMNSTDLQAAYTEGLLTNSSLVTWAARRTATGGFLTPSADTDLDLTARYMGSSMKYFGAIPGFVLILFFVFLVACGQRSINSRAVQLLGRVGSGLSSEMKSLLHTNEKEDHS